MSKRLPLSLLLLVATAIVTALSTAPALAAGTALTIDEILAPQAVTETYGTPRDASVRILERLALQERLAAERVEAALAQPFRVELSSADRQRIDHDGSVERRYLVGVARPVGHDVELSPAGAAASGFRVGPGALRSDGNGDYVWTAAFESRGAAALRLYLSGVNLPKGAELYVYNLAGQAFGPYTGRGPLGNGELHTHTVLGDRLILQLQAQGGTEAAARFRVEDVGVMGLRFGPSRPGTATGGLVTMASNLCSYNADCVVNADCQSTSPVNAAKDAVAGMLFRSGGGYYICTGGLIADNVSSTVIPYFLTANHCINSAREAESLETYFDYANGNCNAPDCSQDIYNNSGDTVGATLMNASSSDDHSLLRLASEPDSADGVESYLGWNSSAVANSDNAPLYRISHPSGSPQAYSAQVVDTDKGTCGTLPRGRYIYSTDTTGATEGGSSGSPVVNASGQIVGQLYGACGFDLNDVCNSADNATVDGAFANAYASLAPFLSPGGGSCSPVGASCTSNSQCCSNSCKGKPGAKVCK